MSQIFHIGLLFVNIISKKIHLILNQAGGGRKKGKNNRFGAFAHASESNSDTEEEDESDFEQDFVKPQRMLFFFSWQLRFVIKKLPINQHKNESCRIVFSGAEINELVGDFMAYANSFNVSESVNTQSGFLH